MINLKKGQVATLGYKKITVGLGWKPNTNGAIQFDLDSCAFCLGSNGKLIGEDYFNFYFNLTTPDGALIHSADDRSGGNSEDGDDEIISIDLEKLNPNVTEIIFTVTIDEAEVRNQNFGEVRNSYIRIVNDDTNQEILRYELDEDFSIETAIEAGRLFKENNEWKFESLGIGYKKDLQFLVDKYL